MSLREKILKASETWIYMKEKSCFCFRAFLLSQFRSSESCSKPPLVLLINLPVRIILKLTRFKSPSFVMGLHFAFCISQILMG